MSDDVKELLGRAFGDEPPLGIDRDEVLRQGRKRLRRRRFLEAGSVVALVVVVAVGASTLTNLAGTGKDDEQHRMPPAASSSDHAPPGPDLPVPSTPVSTRTFEVPADAKAAEQELTTLLYSSGLIDADRVSQVPGQTGQPQFFLKDDRYTYEADYERSSSKRGRVRVEVDLRPTVLVPCGDLAAPTDECETRVVNGTSVTVNRYNDSEERTVRATAVFDGKVRVTAWATNLSHADRELHRTPKGADPVLSENELCILVTKVGQRG